jgi:hypothetical protein
MKTVRNTLISIAAVVASTKVAHMISSLEFEDVLRPLGLSRRVGWPEKLAFLGAGIVVGGVSALLLAPSSGEQTRARLAKKAGELSDAAASQVRQIGESIREQADSNGSPVDHQPATAQVRA